MAIAVSPGNSAPAGEAGAGLALASFNAHAGYDPDGMPFDLAAACLSLEADVIAMQEAWRADGKPDQLSEVADQLGARLLRANLLAGHDLRTMRIAHESVRGVWGLAVLTRLPVVSYQVAYLGRARGDAATRAAQVVTLKLPGGGRLRIANAHLTHRYTSPVQLMRLLFRLSGDQTPTVIAGDLNMPAPVTGLAVGYSPAVKGKTFPAARPVMQLDHILTGPGVASACGRVLAPAGSDHLPIRANLRLP